MNFHQFVESTDQKNFLLSILFAKNRKVPAMIFADYLEETGHHFAPIFRLMVAFKYGTKKQQDEAAAAARSMPDQKEGREVQRLSYYYKPTRIMQPKQFRRSLTYTAPELLFYQRMEQEPFALIPKANEDVGLNWHLATASGLWGSATAEFPPRTTRGWPRFWSITPKNFDLPDIEMFALLYELMGK